MKKIYSLVAVLAATFAANAQSTLPFHDAFDYTVGSPLQTQTGYAALNSGDDILVIEGNLSYPNFVTPTGNKINFAGAGIDTKHAIETVNSGTVYYSFLVKINNVTAATDANGGYLAGFGESNTNFGGTFWLKKVDDANFKFGTEVRTATAEGTTWTTDNYTVGTTYFVVASYTFVDGTNNDVAKMWINPVLGETTEPTATITDQWTASNDLTSIVQFFFRQDSNAETPDVDIDELRIGTTWSSVTPINSTASIVENNIEGLKVYPNPATELVNIVSNEIGTKNITIFNMLGKKVLETSTEETVNVSTLTSGVYIMNINQDGKKASRKLVIK